MLPRAIAITVQRFVKRGLKPFRLYVFTAAKPGAQVILANAKRIIHGNLRNLPVLGRVVSAIWP